MNFDNRPSYVILWVVMGWYFNIDTWNIFIVEKIGENLEENSGLISDKHWYVNKK